MKFSLSFLKQKIKQKKKTNSVLVSPIRPHTDWRRLVIGFSILCLIVVGWSFYLYWTSENTLAVDPFNKATPASDQKSPLEKIDSFFTERAKQRSERFY